MTTNEIKTRNHKARPIHRFLSRGANFAEYEVESVTIRTPDGQLWTIDEGEPIGLRCYSVDEESRELSEHTPPTGDVWHPGDLADYLQAVGRKRN